MPGGSATCLISTSTTCTATGAASRCTRRLSVPSHFCSRGGSPPTMRFVVTVVIGILNGTDIVQFDHNTILTHVHALMLGWITLSVFGAALWMFSEDRSLPLRDRASAARVTTLAAIAVSLYVIAFLGGTGVFRPLAGTLTLLPSPTSFTGPWLNGAPSR
jgi:hypothetical protein